MISPWEFKNRPNASQRHNLSDLVLVWLILKWWLAEVRSIFDFSGGIGLKSEALVATQPKRLIHGKLMPTIAWKSERNNANEQAQKIRV